MPKVKFPGFPGFPGFPRFLNRPSGSGPLNQPLLDVRPVSQPSNTNRDIVFLHACNENDLDLAKQCLIEQPDLVNIVDDYKMTPLHIASDKGHLEIVKLLIEYKADVNKDANGTTPIKLATQNGHLEIVKLLIENKASVNQVTEKGLTDLLHLACIGGHLEVAKELINAKPDLLDSVTGSGFTVLHLACDGGHLEVVKELIKAKPDLLDRVSERGLTVLHYASIVGHLEVVKELIKAKPDLLDKVNKFGKTAIFMASETDNKEALELLIKKGADIYKCDSEGISPIHVASLELNSEIVEMLFNAGANIELGEKEKIEQTIKEDFDEYKLINLENINASIQNSNVNSDELDKKQKKFDEINLILKKITNPIEIQARNKKLNQDQTPSTGILRSSARIFQAKAAFIKGVD